MTQLDHLASLANWLNVGLRTKQLRVRIPLQSLKKGFLHNFSFVAIIKIHTVIAKTIPCCGCLVIKKVFNIIGLNFILVLLWYFMEKCTNEH